LGDLLAHERTLLAAVTDRDQAKLARLLRELVGPFDQETH
jgi:hypothetical protein